MQIGASARFTLNGVSNTLGEQMSPMGYRQCAMKIAAGLAVLAGLATAPVAMADPSNMETFQGCVLELTADQLVVRANEGPVAFNLMRMPPLTTGLKPDDCVTIRAYSGAGAEMTTWFAESIQQGDERVETTGRDITRETTSDSVAKPKKKNDD
jgi:hypothetical protein